MHAGKPSQHSLLRFHLLVLALSVPFWLLGAVGQRFSEMIPVNLPVSALMAVCPLLAALILVYREEKSRGVRRLFQRVFDYRSIRPKIWYVPIILLMPMIALLSYGVMRWMGRPLPEPQIPWLAIPIMFVAYFVGAVTEEAGWMAYVADPMLERWSALRTGLVMGFVWGIWHTVPYLQAHNPWPWIIWQCLFSTAARVLIVWLYNNTGKSVFGAILFHTMINVCWTLFPNYGSHYDPAVTGALTAVAAVIVTSPLSSSRASRRRPRSERPAR